MELNIQWNRYIAGNLVLINKSHMTIPLRDHLWRPISGVEKAEGNLVSNSLPAASQVGNIGLQQDVKDVREL